MRTYKKPVVSVDAGMTEGVYAASGAYTPSVIPASTDTTGFLYVLICFYLLCF